MATAVTVTAQPPACPHALTQRDSALLACMYVCLFFFLSLLVN